MGQAVAVFHHQRHIEDVGEQGKVEMGDHPGQQGFRRKLQAGRACVPGRGFRHGQRGDAAVPLFGRQAGGPFQQARVQDVLGASMPTWNEVLIILALAVIILVVMELHKVYWKISERRRTDIAEAT